MAEETAAITTNDEVKAKKAESAVDVMLTGSNFFSTASGSMNTRKIISRKRSICS